MSKKTQSASNTASGAYQMLCFEQHARQSPDVYIGSVARTTMYVPIYVQQEQESYLHYAQIEMIPGFLTMIGEIMTNARDVMYNMAKENLDFDIRMDIDPEGRFVIETIGKGIVIEKKRVKYGNETIELYVPEMIFSYERTSSNYTGEEKRERLTGGKNGLGAKLTNVYSREFIVETQCEGKYFYQEHSEGNTKHSEAIIKSAGKKPDYVRITFLPDYAFFGIKFGKLIKQVAQAEMIGVFSSTVIYLPKARLFIDGKQIKVHNLVDYVNLFIREEVKENYTGMITYTDTRYQVVLLENLGQLLIDCDNLHKERTMISFVNGLPQQDGKHTKFLSDVIRCTKESRELKKKEDDKQDFAAEMLVEQGKLFRKNVVVFFSMLVDSPSFTSQCKDSLQTERTKWFDTTELEKRLQHDIKKSSLWEKIGEIVQEQFNKNRLMLNKDQLMKMSLHGIEKLQNATLMGKTVNRKKVECSLILAEGVSALSFVESGITEEQKKYYGRFPLRGKIINVNSKNNKVVQENKILMELQRSLNRYLMKDVTIRLQQEEELYQAWKAEKLTKNKDATKRSIDTEDDQTLNQALSRRTFYEENVDKLMALVEKEYKQQLEDMNIMNYQNIVIITDQDYDGFHIKGLFLNIVMKYWPQMLIDGRIKTIKTQIVKLKPATKKLREANILKREQQEEGHQHINEEGCLEFYNFGQYTEWVSLPENGGIQNVTKNYNVSYYKGLGTNTDKEAQEYFKNFEKNLISYRFNHKDKHIFLEDYDSIDLCFNQHRADDRKVWLSEGQAEYLDYSAEKTQVTINEQIMNEVRFFGYDNNRRSICSAYDGLKDSQRKAIFVAMRTLDKTYDENKGGKTGFIKVSQLAGSVSEKTHYAHGEMSMQDTISKLCRDCPGSNNLALLLPKGQFQSLLVPQSAAPRYIFTACNTIVDSLFRLDDNLSLLEYDLDECEDMKKAVPKYLAPVIPLLMVNGTNGIGSGFRSELFGHNIYDVIEVVKDMIRSDEKQKLVAAGKAKKSSKKIQLDYQIFPDYQYRYLDKILTTDSKTGEALESWLNGKIKILSHNKVLIQSLPVKIHKTRWIQFFKKLQMNKKQYEQYIETETKNGNKKNKKEGNANLSKKETIRFQEALFQFEEPLIRDIEDYSCSKYVKIIVHLNEKYFNLTESPECLKMLTRFFKLNHNVTYRGTYFLDKDSKPKLFEKYEDIFQEFFGMRYDISSKEKELKLFNSKRQLDILDAKIKFLNIMIDEEESVKALKVIKKGTAGAYLEKHGIQEFTEYYCEEKESQSLHDLVTSQAFKHVDGKNVAKMEDQQQKLHAQIVELENLSVNRYWLQLIEEFEEQLQTYTAVKDSKYAFYDSEDEIVLKEYNMPAVNPVGSGSFTVPDVVRQMGADTKYIIELEEESDDDE